MLSESFSIWTFSYNGCLLAFSWRILRTSAKITLVWIPQGTVPWLESQSFQSLLESRPRTNFSPETCFSVGKSFAAFLVPRHVLQAKDKEDSSWIRESVDQTEAFLVLIESRGLSYVNRTHFILKSCYVHFSSPKFSGELVNVSNLLHSGGHSEL